MGGAADHNKLIEMLMHLLRRVGWHLNQKGNGTQIGRVGGNVTINHFHAAHISHSAQPTAADVLALLDALEPYGKRDAMLDFMVVQFGTRRVVELDALALRRTWGYARTTLYHERQARRAMRAP